MVEMHKSDESEALGHATSVWSRSRIVLVGFENGQIIKFLLKKNKLKIVKIFEKIKDLKGDNLSKISFSKHVPEYIFVISSTGYLLHLKEDEESKTLINLMEVEN